MSPWADMVGAYTHQQRRLDRLTTFHRGNLDANDAIPAANRDYGEDWTLSAVGNWEDFQVDENGDGDVTDASDLDQDRTHNDVNEVTGITEQTDPQQSQWADPVYSARGNTTTLPQPSDLTSTYTATYDAWNRLVEIKDGETTVATYRYDAVGRRIAKLVPNGSNWDRTDYYYSAGPRVIEERSAENQADPDTVASDPQYQYVWGMRYVHAPVLRDEDTDADGDCTDDGGSQRLYYSQDANFNVTALVEPDGDVAERVVYDPYGQPTFYDGAWANPSSSSAYANEILFTGHRLDPETGLYYCLARHYHPALGRWLQRDPVGYRDGMGLYTYAMSSPGLYVDPTGGASIPTPGVPLGGSSLGVIADETHRHPAFAEGIAETLRDLCPCFSYKIKDPGGGAKATPYGMAKVITLEGNPEYKDKMKFCCCYYEHLPGCNLLYKLATEGAWSQGHNVRGVIPTGYGASVPTGGLALRLTYRTDKGDNLRSKSATNTEEFAHGAYSIHEYGAKRAKEFVYPGGKPQGGTQRPTPRAVRQLDKALVDLVRDKFDCSSVLGDGARAMKARNAAQRFWDRAQKMRNVVTNVKPEDRLEMPKRYLPLE